MRYLAILAWMPLLGGCGYEASRLAHQAQINLIGMTAQDLQTCAGIPDKTQRLDERNELYAYHLRNASGGEISTTLPIIGGGVTIGSSGTFCTANFRLTDGRVSALVYAGDTDRGVGTDGVCAPIIRGCLRQPMPSMRPLDRDSIAASSAYHAPPVPPVPVGAAPVPGLSMAPIGR
ncbi:hypothetical protein MVG78_08575 [Roseomonas gilardii subsp. gilardii]|uniref:hypothetical protein n=1 Tax=Roseomonas gilardii TaxID=257708 RepID=UPI001FF8C76E|nr:hypothetical protein [Roseomonas gilardii]UPG74159.1 hypothetical protein MVG78_08575 [Roseomonas gilardii subsp. gilardii]